MKLRRPAIDTAAAQPDAALLLVCVLPFAGPIVLSIVLVLLSEWLAPVPPLAPGQGWALAPAGAVAALLLWGAVLRWLWGRTANPAWRKAGGALALGCALLGLPVMTLGVMQWLNGSFTAAPQATRMALQGLSTSTASKSTSLHYWAHLPGDASAGLPKGKYLIDGDSHAAWSATRPATVTVHHARGLLGARVLRGFSG